MGMRAAYSSHFQRLEPAAGRKLRVGMAVAISCLYGLAPLYEGICISRMIGYENNNCGDSASSVAGS
jgi:hypothetical protein